MLPTFIYRDQKTMSFYYCSNKTRELIGEWTSRSLLSFNSKMGASLNFKVAFRELLSLRNENFVKFEAFCMLFNGL